MLIVPAMIICMAACSGSDDDLIGKAEAMKISVDGAKYDRSADVSVPAAGATLNFGVENYSEWWVVELLYCYSNDFSAIALNDYQRPLTSSGDPQMKLDGFYDISVDGNKMQCVIEPNGSTVKRRVHLMMESGNAFYPINIVQEASPDK